MVSPEGSAMEGTADPASKWHPPPLSHSKLSNYTQVPPCPKSEVQIVTHEEWQYSPKDLHDFFKHVYITAWRIHVEIFLRVVFAGRRKIIVNEIRFTYTGSSREDMDSTLSFSELGMPLILCLVGWRKKSNVAYGKLRRNANNFLGGLPRKIPLSRLECYSEFIT